jgi:hypothetical protein
MSIDVTASTVIARRPDVVAAFAMEAQNDTRWIGGISSVRRLTPGPTAVGTRVERIASFMGKRIEYVMEVERLAPGREIALRSIKSPFPMLVTYAFEEHASGTRATVRVAGDPDGFYKLAGPLMVGAIRKNLNGDLKRLKRILEDERADDSRSMS